MGPWFIIRKAAAAEEEEEGESEGVVDRDYYRSSSAVWGAMGNGRRLFAVRSFGPG